MTDEQQFLDYEGLALFKEFLNAVDAVTATSGDGIAYTATIPNMTELKRSKIITIIPDITSNATIPTLNVNGLGAKNIKQRLSVNTSLTAEASTPSWMIAKKPVPLLFDGTQWVTITGRPSATAIHGAVPIKNGGTEAESAAEALVNLGAQAKHKTVTATLTVDGWTNNSQTIAIRNVTENNTVLVGSSPSNNDAYTESGVLCTAQGNGTLTFTCKDKPNVALQANIIILD